MKKLILPILSLLILLSNADARTWTNQAGVSFEGELVEADDKNAIIRRTSDRRKFTMSISDLSQADQNYIIKHQEAEEAKRNPGDGLPKTKEGLIEWLAGTEWEVTIRERGKDDKTTYRRFLIYGMMQTSNNGEKWSTAGKCVALDAKSFVFSNLYTVSIDDRFRKFEGASAEGSRTVIGRLKKKLKEEKDTEVGKLPETKDGLIQWLTGTVWKITIKQEGKTANSNYRRFLDQGIVQSSSNGKKWYPDTGKCIAINKNTFIFSRHKYTVSLDDSFRTFNGTSVNGLKTVTGKLEESR